MVDTRFGGKSADGSIGALGKLDVAEEIGKRKDRAKRFGLPVPVFAAEVRQQLCLPLTRS